MKKSNVILNIILNAIVVISTFYSIVVMVLKGVAMMPAQGVQAFRYYTVDSNAIYAFSSIIYIFLLIKYLKNPKYKLPQWFCIIRFICVVTIFVTFVTCALFLGSIYGFKNTFTGITFVLHFTSPVFAFISYCFLEREKLEKKYILTGNILEVIYGIIYFLMVIVFKTWPDFYQFNQGGKALISAIIMTIGTLLISLLTRYLHNKACK